MNGDTGMEWRKEFGIGDVESKFFIGSKAELNTPGMEVSQRHVLRRAFDLLKLEGILCTDNAPLVYFKQVRRIEPGEVVRLHQRFWNHGGAPILVLITKDEVHVYSGLTRPVAQVDRGRPIPGLVDTLERASSAVREFLPAVESGEFFRQHQKSFDPAHRVDRDLLHNLQSTRQKLIAFSTGRLDPKVLDALLCRLVFACYLFDRKVILPAYLEAIGLRGASHLRDVLGVQPKSKAKEYLYKLFRKLGQDFNGDLFSDDLDAEASQVSSAYLDPLDEFFRATDVQTGQISFPFWIYDFGAIPIETISAIYERFLKSADQRREKPNNRDGNISKGEGVFYTPRFLADLVLDLALAAKPSLLGHRYLDPACGSGIFLVGLFNRMAEEWTQANPEARNDRRARELRKILCESICGVDINPTACRISAFSLYLAYLDQLSSRDIQELQQKGHKLPRLVHFPESGGPEDIEGNIWCGDFFSEDAEYSVDADLVVGNPPWGSTAVDGTPAAKWCANPDHLYPVPDKQVAVAFVWKATHHAVDTGRICLVLPHGTLFNHSTTALEFQRTFFQRQAVDHVLNLADYQRFLFEEAGHPALVIDYQKKPPVNHQHAVQYWAPKADWLVTRAEVIAIMPEDRSTVTVGQVLQDLDGPDAPQIWKQRHWATPRDWRLIDRLSLYPRLRDRVRGAKEGAADKPWLMAEGFQPLGENDDPAKAETIALPSKLFIKATSSNLNLFLLPGDCTKFPAPEVTVRSGSNKGTDVFRTPHVLVAKGFTSIAFADFDVSFRHALRGISGPKNDRDLLIFLAAYLRSAVAKYFLFQTSSNWGVSRQEVHVEELGRLPFPMPDVSPTPRRAWEIVREVAQIVTSAAANATEELVNREDLVRIASDSIEALVDEYFDILPLEKAVINDTVRVIIPSVRPTRKRPVVPTIDPSKEAQRDAYVNRLCETLNGWAKSGPFIVQGHAGASTKLGIGVAILQKVRAGEAPSPPPKDLGDLLSALHRLRDLASQKLNTFELIRGAKVFDGDSLYIVKPIGQRFWTQTAALNDADEVASTILMCTPEGVACQ
jgi:type I restriction-modification system DNA methylase subunit